MSDPITTPGAPLPEFSAPPVVEVALGVQFRPVFALRPIELSFLREQWRAQYPTVREELPLPSTIESPSGPPTVHLVVGPALQTRMWFLDQEQVELVQLQHDRLTVNWRQSRPDVPYPRYPVVRRLFEERLADVRSFVENGQFGSLDVTQVEVTYTNALYPDDGHLGRLDHILRDWAEPVEHHLGEPEQARALFVFTVPEIGRAPVRLYVSAEPAQRLDGRPFVLFQLMIRGAAADESIGAALRFMDQGHEHVVRSFAELTPTAMHEKWGRLQ